ncbi:hypothetical protein [Metabacillus fastidiosus]
MDDQQLVSMSEYYTKRYGTPRDDNDAIYKLIPIYKDLFGEIPT